MAPHGWLGLALVLFIKVVRLTARKFPWLEPVDSVIGQFFTPLVWWGYVLFLDGWLARKTGRSWIAHYRRESLWMLVSSNLCWLIFEGYNLLIKNWVYIGLAEHPLVDWSGRILAYATIFPGIFLTASMLAVLFNVTPDPRRSDTPTRLETPALIVGALFLLYPLVFPNPYLFAPVWLGFIFFLDPILARFREKSLFREVAVGNWRRTVLLLAAGYICGFLWEYWNTWATARWVYTLPFPTLFKIYEMPLMGFLGFGPFALECYCMYLASRLPWKLHRDGTVWTDDILVWPGETTGDFSQTLYQA